MKTARFTSVVARAGKPEAHLLLVEAGKDRTLQSAIKANRVMSVRQTLTGQKKDYGVVGYDPKIASQVLIFPKSLRAFRDARIVGIDYSLLDEPERETPKNVTPFPAPKAPPAAKEKAPSPPPRTEAKPQTPPPRGRAQPSSKKPVEAPRREKPVAKKTAESESRPKNPAARKTAEAQPGGTKPVPRKAAAVKEPKSLDPAALKRKLETVLREWEKGHEVKAHRMLAAVVEEMGG